MSTNNKNNKNNKQNNIKKQKKININQALSSYSTETINNFCAENTKKKKLIELILLMISLKITLPFSHIKL